MFGTLYLQLARSFRGEYSSSAFAPDIQIFQAASRLA